MKQQAGKAAETSQPILKQQQKPFKIFNIAFVNKRTFVEFIVTSLLIIVVPVISVVVLNNWVKDDPNISELNKVLIAVVPALVFINIVACAYTYKAVKDPENYKVDPPLKIKLKPN